MDGFEHSTNIDSSYIKSVPPPQIGDSIMKATCADSQRLNAPIETSIPS